MKPILNKWQIGFSVQKDWRTLETGWKAVNFYILKLKSLPENGVMLTKENYEGFQLLFKVWLPIDSY